MIITCGSNSKIVVNADDLGLNEDVNRAIFQAFREGLCSSASIMANMPGFEEACETVHERHLRDRIGVHVNLTAGVPLTEAMRLDRHFCCEEGYFLGGEHRSFAMLFRRKHVELLRKELLAQINRCRDFGLPLTHLDTHHHVHVEPALAKVILEVARTSGIHTVRLAELNARTPYSIKNVYRVWFNRNLRGLGLAAVDVFAKPKKIAARPHHGKTRLWSAEVMVHPNYDGNGVLVESLCGTPLHDYLRPILAFAPFVSFEMLGDEVLRWVEIT